MEMTFMTIQYRSNPEGALYRMKKNMTGIPYIMNFPVMPLCWVPAWLILNEKIIEAPYRIGSNLMSLPINGRENDEKCKIDSGKERSSIHPGMNMAPRSSKCLFKRPYNAMKIGNWNNIGRQPPSGLIF